MRPSDRPPGIQSILDELAIAPAFDSLDALNRHLARRMHDYNAQPQPELGGLSPDEVQQLLSGDWETTGALRVAEDATLDELRDVPILADARTLLAYVAERAPVKLTNLGNLSRAAVAELVPQLRTLHVDDEMVRFRAAYPIRNEGDANWLVLLRHVLLFARLLGKRKGLIVTGRGRELLDDGHAGALYALLFRTFFRQVDLQFLYLDERHAALQSTLAFTLHQLRHAPTDWTAGEALAATAWLESARDPMTAWEEEHGDTRHMAFEHRVLRPLAMFGLFEWRRTPGVERWSMHHEYRRTALFQRVLRFEFDGRRRGELFLMR